VARRHHVAAEEAGCRQIRPAHPRCARPTGDRDRVIELLRAAVADGRLDPAEFDQRLDAALAARTIDALTPLTADLIAAPGSDSSLALPLAGTPAEPAAEVLTIRERHGSVRRDGRWTLPRRLVLRTAWCDVMLDLTSAVPSGPELVIELRVRGGNVELVPAERTLCVQTPAVGGAASPNRAFRAGWMSGCHFIYSDLASATS
jgi:hypothetical protein